MGTKGENGDLISFESRNYKWKCVVIKPLRRVRLKVIKECNLVTDRNNKNRI